MPDNAILKKAAKGDERAFETLIAEYEKLIYSIAYRIMGNQEDAKDVFQETVIKIYRNLASCRGVEFIKAWIAKITHNTCMDEIRRRRGKFVESLDALTDTGEDAYERYTAQADESHGPEARLLQKELAQNIEEALGQLTPNHRALVVLRDVQGLSYEEISEIANLPLGTVKSRISRGRESLKKILIAKQQGEQNSRSRRINNEEVE